MFYSIVSVRKKNFFVSVTRIKAAVQEITLNSYFCLVDNESTIYNLKQKNKKL